MKSRNWVLPAVVIIAIPLGLTGCMVRDDDNPDVVATPPSSTTIIKDDTPAVHVNPTPNVTIENKRPPDVNINVENPPIVIKQDPPPKSTTGY